MVLGGLLWGGVPAWAGTGSVDWQHQVLRATGNGPPDVRAGNLAQARLGAERAAREHAFTDLLEVARSLPLGSARTVGDALAQEPVRQRVEEVLRAHRVVRKDYYSDGGVRWEVEVPLGALASALEPIAPAETKPSESRENAPSKVTGVVVDARKTGLTPVLVPALVDATSGTRLYGLASLGVEVRKEAGVAGYFRTLEEARKEGRVGAKPLVLEAAGLQGTELQLGPDAVRALSGVDPRLLAEGRVAILFP